MTKKLFTIYLVQASFISITSIFCMGFVNAAGCTSLDGPNTITESCTNLRSGDGKNNPLTINPGVTVSSDPSTSAAFQVVGSTVTTFDNLGTISSTNQAVMIRSNSTITTFNNSGNISGGVGIQLGNNAGETSTITTLNNTGSISATSTGITLGSSSFGGSASISTLNNSGSIYGFSRGIWLDGGSNNTVSITTLINTGTIYSGNGSDGSGIKLNANSTITTLTNDGIISGSTAGIINAGTIVTLNNSQNGGRSVQPLVYSGVLPTNYNINFNSTGYGLLSLVEGYTGSTNVSVNIEQWKTSKQAVLSSAIYKQNGTTISQSSFNYTPQTFTIGAASGVTKQVVNSNGTISYVAECTSGCTVTNIPGQGVFPVFPGLSTASSLQTQVALNQTLASVQDVAALQTQSMITGFSNDCKVFDANNICLSAGGRYTNISPDSVNNSSVILVGAYKVDDHTRVGVSIDQNLSASNANGIVNQDNKLPLFGAFAVWNQNPNLVGWGARSNLGYGQKGMDITRPTITNLTVGEATPSFSEPGQGSTKVSTFGVQAVGRYGFDIATDAVISPYVGIRYNQSKINGFSEAATSSVILPLTYSAFGSNGTTALLGGQLDYRSGPWSAWLNIGMEYDMIYNSDQIIVTGFNNVTASGNYNANNVRSRFVSGAYGAYDIAKNQRISLGANFRQTEFSGVDSASVMAFYSMGF